jgi:GDP-mannose transporter
MSTISKSSSSEELLPTHLKKESSAFTGIMSCTVYSLCSISMVLVNKYISSSLSEEVKQKLPQLSVVLYQCIIAVVLVEFARFMKWVDYPQFSFKTARQWLPVNLLFIGMLCSSFIALIYISVPMFTVFKNLSNIITVTGDWYLFKEP